jgi:hypothetical protein
LVSIMTAVAAQDAARSVEDISNRRSVTIDALHNDAARQECVDRTEVKWMQTLTEALLMPPDTPEQAQAVEKLRPIAGELATVDERCYDENPVPTAPDGDGTASPETQPAASTAGKAGRDGQDGVDGRNGRDGAPGADGKDGADGADGTSTNGKDGRDGADGRDAVPIPGPAGPQGPPGESIIGPPGESIEGPQGPPGYDGQAPRSWRWTFDGVTFECSDPDGDLNYSCEAVAA